MELMKVVLIFLSATIALIVDLGINKLVAAFMVYWLLNLAYNLVNAKRYNKYLFCLREEVFSLILLVPLFMSLNLNPVFLPLAVLGLTELLLTGYDWIMQLKSKPVQH
ncbi:MAG: hypothetical protein KJ601_05930 [Nanoarchaeota archaeon]|nr:hypothetical protein [Nanoarchaeota archaeon]MBU1704914.1 hypothetical protein [Nanoarchaeota archaeon]